MPKRDVQATEARHFKDPGSFVFKDQREWLEGEDWDDRKRELEQRSRNRCENILGAGMEGGVIRLHPCGRDAVHPHHIVLRSIARDDRIENLLAVCFDCHRKLDAAQRKQRGKYLTKPLTEAQLLGLEPREDRS